MGSAIWSSGREQILRFPARYFVEFFHNHGFLGLKDGTVWRTVKGGSSCYVEALTRSFADRIRLNSPITAVSRDRESVQLCTADCETEKFDRVIIATHSDQALAILTDPTDREKEILGSMPYQPNETVLHTDATLLPRNRRAWASWNYRISAQQTDHPSVTYHMNSLQGLDSNTNFCVTLNQTDAIEPGSIISTIDYQHPVYTSKSVLAQSKWSDINGQNHTYFCGAYWGCGFHEDGVNSALRVCREFGRDLKDAA
jgi:predicted NAD/FAD-binding protein